MFFETFEKCTFLCIWSNKLCNDVMILILCIFDLILRSIEKVVHYFSKYIMLDLWLFVSIIYTVEHWFLFCKNKAVPRKILFSRKVKYNNFCTLQYRYTSLILCSPSCWNKGKRMVLSEGEHRWTRKWTRKW